MEFRRFLYLGLIILLLYSCSQKETPLPEKSYFLDYEGTYAGFLFPGEKVRIKKLTNILAKSSYFRGNKRYDFLLNFDNNINSSSTFPLDVLYCRIDSSYQIFGGQKDYDSLSVGIQNAKFSKTNVFGEIKSLQFSVVIDSVVFTRSFIQ